METSLPPRDRWLLFSLRTLFVLVTLACIYLGWAMNWIRQRREYLRLNPAREVRLSTLAGDPVAAPWSLWIFQEQGIATIGLFGQYAGDPHVSDYDEMVAASRLFPEAKMDSLDFPFYPGMYGVDDPPRYGNGMPSPYYQNGAWVFP